MVFSSFVFLFLFLPVVLLCYYVCPPKGRNFVLLVFSLLFYAWGEPKYVLIMLFSTVFDYTNGRLIAYGRDRGKARFTKTVLVIDLVGNLGILGFFKYTDFFINSINSITGAGISLLHIALPIGISFYTFQTMSYTIDVYRGTVPAQRNILNFATYVTLFPQLIAGPIVQYKTIADELEKRNVGWEDFSEGALRFSVGLAKKVILANQIGSLWTQISGAQSLTVASAWLGAIAYTFQIYFDFSGYSDMAIGLGRMFGFHFLENFDHPYISTSITEFWRRWHISLSGWFREYVYIPLGGNRKGVAANVRNLLIVWALTGLWHGASVNFILWGLYYGVLLILEKFVFAPVVKKCNAHGFGHLYTMFFVIAGWVIFAQTDMSALGTYLKAMVGIGVPAVSSDFLYYLSTNAVLLVLLVICSLDWKRAKEKLALWRGKSPVRSAVLSAVWMVLLLGLSTAFLVGDSYNPFLYFRF
jgi:alginate O-acetyltransferase complex protein AlgI